MPPESMPQMPPQGGAPAGPMPGMPPGMPPGPMDPSQAGGAQDVGPDARNQLMQMLDQLQSKRGEFNSMQFANKNATESQRQDALMQVFQAMQKSGIDPSNVEEVKSFLDQLEQQNPELYQIFVQAFEQLLGTGADAGGMTGADASGLAGVPNAPGGPGDLSGALAGGMPGMAMPPGAPAGPSGPMPGMPPGMPPGPMPAGPGAQFPNLGG